MKTLDQIWFILLVGNMIDLTEIPPVLKEIEFSPFFAPAISACTNSHLLAQMKLKICCTEDQAYIYTKDSIKRLI